uniref:NADH dehydrogenase subunit 4L n=1 Tax=Paralepas cf. quadrata TaxID=2977351 RepID=UPI0021CCD6F6|nr:NADH dehydrogenase subunit 4L [Paralepas cf. quadrata]UWM12982.1 NADH dehydrogenase subunit 4L [Paralepas cf. quadrata]
MNLFLALPLFLLVSGFWVFISKRKHLISMLISLEYLALTGFFLIMITSLFTGLEMYLGLLFLVVTVCEGSLGVSIMVNMVRSYGSDYSSSLMALKC